RWHGGRRARFTLSRKLNAVCAKLNSHPMRYRPCVIDIVSSSVSLPWARRKIPLELSGHAIEFLRICSRLAFDRDIRPHQRIVGIEFEPILEPGLGVRDDCL